MAISRKKNSDPQGIELAPGPKAFLARSKKPLVVGLTLLGVFLLIYIVTMTQRGQVAEQRQEPGMAVERPADNASRTGGHASGFQGLVQHSGPAGGLVDDASPPPETGRVPAPQESVPDEGGPRLVTVHIPSSKAVGRLGEADDDLIREQEDIRRMRMEALRNAINSPLRTGVQTQPAGAAGFAAASAGVPFAAPSAAPSRLDMDKIAAHIRGDSPDTQARLDAAASGGGLGGGVDFFASGGSGAGQGTGSATDSSWQLGFQRQPGKPFELKTGALIPGVLISSINSELAGAISAQVSQDVFDSATGRWLLIPKGSRLFGDYASDVRLGQSRLFVSWKRVIFPDGSSITLGEMRGSDEAGQSGFEDQVNNHYARIFGSAILMSMITAGVTYSVDQFNRDKPADAASVQSEASVALAQQIGQASMAMLQRNMNIAPTVEIRSGYRFLVVVAKDLVFNAPYAPMAAR
ncbi:MAG: hypothetical protein LBD82_02940 [Deltaproteobacteria bacterium]|jgi:type IV secretion system protein VirB10|nr:hypothetical protein [Deltaproteobacteria bacterium]